MKIVYFGHNQRGITCLKALHNSKQKVVSAIAQDGEKGWYSSIEETAKTLGMPVSVENNPNKKEVLKKIRDIKPDLIVMCGYSKIIGNELLEIPEYGCINLHASLLPYYRGAAPLNWALINGEEKIGLSIYTVDSGIDTGPILDQKEIIVPLEYTIKNVLDETLKIYPKMLLDICDEIERGKAEVKIQNPEEGSYYTKRFPKDGIINFEMTDFEAYNKIRALTHPYPGAFFYSKGKKIFVWGAELEKKNYYGVPGRVATKKGGLVAIFKNRGMKIKKVQREGGAEVDARDLFKVGEDLQP